MRRGPYCSLAFLISHSRARIACRLVEIDTASGASSSSSLSSPAFGFVALSPLTFTDLSTTTTTASMTAFVGSSASSSPNFLCVPFTTLLVFFSSILPSSLFSSIFSTCTLDSASISCTFDSSFSSTPLASAFPTFSSSSFFSSSFFSSSFSSFFSSSSGTFPTTTAIAVNLCLFAGDLPFLGVPSTDPAPLILLPLKLTSPLMLLPSVPASASLSLSESCLRCWERVTLLLMPC